MSVAALLTYTLVLLIIPSTILLLSWLSLVNPMKKTDQNKLN